MNRQPNRTRRYIAIALIVLLMPFFVLGSAVAATGTVTVQVQETGPDGVKLWIPVPALLIDVALLLAPAVIPDDALDEARREIEPYRDSLEALAEEIRTMPAGVLVDVQTGDEHVRVTKTWRSFQVAVDSPDADIQVSVPARFLSRALEIL